ncbi:hypothetical protein PAPHI01_1897 [Pancytospora philotis]|nr:hypothetical protein PAPHI01_1897 [Pancytospora philotis]
MSSIDKFNEDNALFFNRKESGVKNSLYEHMALNSSGHCFRSTDFEFFSEVLCIGRNPSEKPDLKSILQSYVDICSYVCDKADELTADIDAYLMEKARRVKDENIEMTEEIRFEVHEYIEEHKDKFEEAYDYVRTQLSSACSRLRYLESVLTRFNQKRI